MIEPLRLGIIGAGLAVKHLHWPALQRLRDQYRCVAVADVDGARAADVAQLVGAAHTFTDYRELLALDAVEAVLLSLPIHLTAPITLAAAQAGKHVILEKPVGTNLEQARTLCTQVAPLPVAILVAENFRYRADIRKARQMIDAGALGDVIFVRMHALGRADTTDPQSFASTPWRRDPQYRGGQMLDGGVHHAAALRMLMGEAEWIQAFLKHGHSDLNGPTTMSMNLRFRSGALGSYVYSAVCQDNDPAFMRLTIYGSTGTLDLSDKQGLRLIHPDRTVEMIALDNDADTHGYYGEFLNFYTAIREGAPVVATMEESYKDMELILRAVDSAEEARVILL